MKLSELLDELREGILNDRTDRTAGTSDYLWTDTRLTRYISEAQTRFAMRGLVLRDGSTDEVTKVTLVEGQDTYDLHEAVIAVISAKVESAAGDLARVGHAFLNAYRQPDETLTFAPSSSNSGTPLAFSTDEEVTYDDCNSLGAVKLRVYPTPDASAAGTVLRLRVVRKPLCDFDVNQPGQEPEIPSEHHLDMLDWAAYLALRIVDDDAGAPKRAAEFRVSFEQHVLDARRNAMRKLFAPTPFGFGRRGWSWEH